jgi:Na+-translocating ferredoxin:NAD+ oxidoreductase RnfG subunit
LTQIDSAGSVPCMDSNHIKTEIRQGKDKRHMVYFCTKDGNHFLTEVTIIDVAVDLCRGTWPVGGAKVVLVGEEFRGTDMYGETVIAHRERPGTPVVFESAQGRGDK